MTTSDADRCGWTFNGLPDVYTRLVTNRSILARALRMTHRAAYELISAGPLTTFRVKMMRVIWFAGNRCLMQLRARASSLEPVIHYASRVSNSRIIGCVNRTLRQKRKKKKRKERGMRIGLPPLPCDTLCYSFSTAKFLVFFSYFSFFFFLPT
jgi:hypothetical protein